MLLGCYPLIPFTSSLSPLSSKSDFSIIAFVVKSGTATARVSDLLSTGSTEKTLSCIHEAADLVFDFGDVFLLKNPVVTGMKFIIKSKDAVYKIGKCPDLEICEAEKCQKPVRRVLDGKLCWDHVVDSSMKGSVRSNIGGGTLKMKGKENLTHIETKQVKPNDNKVDPLQARRDNLTARKHTALWLQERSQAPSSGIHAHSQAIMTGHIITDDTKWDPRKDGDEVLEIDFDDAATIAVKNDAGPAKSAGSADQPDQASPAKKKKKIIQAAENKPLLPVLSKEEIEKMRALRQSIKAGQEEKLS
jgi:hypothetical protein